LKGLCNHVYGHIFFLAYSAAFFGAYSLAAKWKMFEFRLEEYRGKREESLGCMVHGYREWEWVHPGRIVAKMFWGGRALRPDSAEAGDLVDLL
jgi:hypothetical protein